MLFFHTFINICLFHTLSGKSSLSNRINRPKKGRIGSYCICLGCCLLTLVPMLHLIYPHELELGSEQLYMLQICTLMWYELTVVLLLLVIYEVRVPAVDATVHK